MMTPIGPHICTSAFSVETNTVQCGEIYMYVSAVASIFRGYSKSYVRILFEMVKLE